MNKNSGTAPGYVSTDCARVMGESHLFYQTAVRRPRVSRAEGIYLGDTSGKRYYDASSGPMVSNIGH